MLAEEILEKPADAKKADKTAKATAAHEAKEGAAKQAGAEKVGAPTVAAPSNPARAVDAPAGEPAGDSLAAAEEDEALVGKKLLVMKTTRFGDDRDRPLFKTSGEPTYFAADVAYHWNKIQRGYKRMINVWGADHGGYVQRMKAAVQSMGGELEAILPSW